MAGSEQNPLSPTRVTLSPRAAAEKERRRRIAAKRNRAANPRNPAPTTPRSRAAAAEVYLEAARRAEATRQGSR